MLRINQSMSAMLRVSVILHRGDFYKPRDVTVGATS